MEVPEVTDGQQEETEVSVTEGESERSFSSTLRAFYGYRIRMNSILLTDQLKKTQGILAIVHLFGKGRRSNLPIS